MVTIMYKQDWIIRQIEMFIQFIRILIGEKSEENTVIKELFDTDITSYNLLEDTHNKINRLLSEDKINEAENLLFVNLDKNDRRYLLLALDFYDRLNRYNDDSLESAGYSREEIKEAIRDVSEIYGLQIPENIFP